MQDAALASGWMACSFTFDGHAIAGFKACDTALQLGAATFNHNAAVFAVAHPPRAAMRLGSVWPVLPHIKDVSDRQLQYGQWLHCGMLCIGCFDSHESEKLISVSVLPDASVGNTPSPPCSASPPFPYTSAFHFTIGSVTGPEHFSLPRSCGAGGRVVMCNGTGLLIIQPDKAAAAAPSSAPSPSGIMFPYTLTAPGGGVRATWVDVFNQLSKHSTWPTYKASSLNT